MVKLKTLIMESSKEDAALDYLSKLVKDGPFKGRVFLAGAVRDMELGKKPKDLDVVVIGGVTSGLEFAIWATKKMGNYKGGDDVNLIKFVKNNWEFISSKEDEDNNVNPNDPKIIKIKNLKKELTVLLKPFSNPVMFPTYGTSKFTLQGIIHNGMDLSSVDIEAVMTRKEKYTDGSRKPEVSSGDLSDDVNRRDFTVNSLLQDLSTGEILDLTGKGREDIKKGLVQTPLNPDIIFTEDPLRILRAVRFAIKYNWDLPMFMLRSMKRNAIKLENISSERIRDELDKMLLTNSPAKAVKLLKITGILKYVIPELLPAVKMKQNVHHKDDVFVHTLDVLSKTKPILVQRLMGLFHDIGKTVTKSVTPTGIHFYGHEMEGSKIAEDVMRRLKYPVELIDAVKLGVKNHMRLKSGGDTAVNLTDKTLRKFKTEMGEHLENLLDVMHADNIAHASASSMPNQVENVRKRLTSLNMNMVHGKPKLPITGNDLQSLGLKPGPIFSEIMKAVTDAWFENPNLTKEQGLDIAKKVAGI